MTSTAGRDIAIRGYVPAPCAFAPCFPSFTVPTNLTFFPRIEAGKTTQGAVLLVERQFASRVAVDLRVQDVSRQAQTWGTEIPAVREGRFLTAAFDLLDVPLAAGFRQTLRIYDVDALPGATAVVRSYKIDSTAVYPNRQTNPQPAPDTLLAEKVIVLQTEQRPESPAFDFGYAEIASVAAIPELQGADRIRIEIIPAAENRRLWALVSVTNNETQHVTVITPQQ